MSDESESIGVILCTGGKNYQDDDLNILSILSKQVTVAMQLYDYSEQNVKHKLIAKELNILNTYIYIDLFLSLFYLHLSYLENFSYHFVVLYHIFCK